MLRELSIQNFAIIPELRLRFKPGLTTFTGETGAGKSIMLDALEVLTGGRTDNSMIRSGAEIAQLEAVFTLPESNRPTILHILEEQGLTDDSEDSIILGREIRKEGRNIARINGRMVSTGILRDVGSYLVDIHGQSEHLSLLKVKEHIHLLDRYCKNESLLTDYQHIYRTWHHIHHELDDLRKAEADAARQQDLLNYQIQEIEAATLQDGEEDELHNELNRLANAEKLATLCQKASSLLESSELEARGVNEQMGEISQALHRVAEIDNEVNDLAVQSDTVLSLIEDINRALQDYMDTVEYNPKRLEQVENRISLINSLTRKYGTSITEVLDFAGKAKKQLDKITHAEERIQELETEEKEVLQQLAQKGSALSENRQRFANLLGQKMEAQLADLRMEGAKFKADIQQLPDPQGLQLAHGEIVHFDENGIDKVEFLIAPNPGEGLKPLVKIASGGETSRLMLALKNVLAEADTIPTLIFDEIDQGIGGRIGAIVGEKLWQLGRSHQVLCVTHLPQLAAFGIQHYRVHKLVQEGRTITQVDDINGEARVRELANMFGGDTEANRKAALEVLSNANQHTEHLQNSSEI
ncbi:MAG: DNA repair protein RecN [Anaerolinea thermophila]|uniref:DNA repair protein RecN n=1 Tax=Anaerolinea thermophila TaxID=167964 RepID=A0A101FXE5_9CHLR|nr:MAG: DNA repair protein RecN [Anaerolinea thermophila]